MSISNSKGKNIANIELGNLDKGAHEFTWDGKGNDGNRVESGQYSILFSATNPSGADIPIEKNAGKVIAVQFSQGGTTFVTDQNKKVKMSDIKSVFEGSV